MQTWVCSTRGSIQGCMRPVVVVSNNMANKHSTIITVVPLSTKNLLKKRNLPTHVFVSAYKKRGTGATQYLLFVSR